MAQSETHPMQPSATPVLSSCPQCHASLAILRVFAGKAGSEYWTMRCIRCGGIHLDIVQSAPPAHVG
jgi:hypothetical protein